MLLLSTLLASDVQHDLDHNKLFHDGSNRSGFHLNREYHMPKKDMNVAHPSNETGDGFVWDWSDTAKNDDYVRLTPRSSQVK